jgi:hypothetical protein
MTASSAFPKATSSNARLATAGVQRLVGEAVYMYAFDIAYEMDRRPVASLLGQPVAEFAVDSSKRSPRHLFFFRPQMVRLPALERLTPHGSVRVERAVKMLPVGAISITFRVPFAVDALEELTGFHDFRFSDGSYLSDEARRLAWEVRQELTPHLVRPVERLRDDEAYTAFCIHGPLCTADGTAVRCEDWLAANRRMVAAILTEEPDPGLLSEQEAEESTCRSYSYYERDLVVIDWDAALIIDEPRNFDETLYLMEVANTQLAELEAYDRILDDSIERSYRDVAAKRFRGFQTTRIQAALREIRIDMARLSDELSNITKFFGDWHAARVYQGVAARFHLSDWHRAIDDKLKTVDDLYQLLRSEQNHRSMMVLELSVVIMFIIDLVILAAGLKK